MKTVQHISEEPDFVALARAWRTDGVTKLLSYLWTSYDALRDESPTTLNVRDEINVTSHLESWIQRKKPKNCPFDIQHAPPELTTRLNSSTPSPTPDFGFFPWADRRAMFPLEAKVLKTDGDLSAYLTALRLRFLQCRYAPHSSAGVMIGYLLAGDPGDTFKKLRKRLRTKIVAVRDFKTRAHRVSSHRRRHRRCKQSPISFRCHHLLMVMY